MFEKLTIRTRLFLLLAVLVLGTIAAGTYGVFSLMRFQRVADASFATSSQLMEARESVRASQLAFRTQILDFKNLLLRGHDPEQHDWYLSTLRKDASAAGAAMDDAAALVQALGIDTAALQEARGQHAAITQQHLDALGSFRQGDAASALEVDGLVRGKDRELDEKIEAIVKNLQEAANGEGTRLRQAVAEDTQRGIVFFGGLVAVLTLVALGAGLAVVRSLLRELGGEPAYAKQVAARVAAGDLAVAVAVRRGDTDSVIAAMQRMSESLRAIVGEVSAGARGVADASSQLAQGNLDLSQRTEEQATTLEETASQMEELTTIVAQNAQHAAEASQFAATASGVARQGGEVFGEVVSTMAGISEASARIGDIIGVIDGIAFQTNILALNAAVEAARAGEQGRGFAVVAAEVRNLAQRSATAAREIKALIANSVERAEAGTRLVDAAGRTMQDIVQAVNRVSERIAGIASASHEQSAGIEQVNRAVSQMDHVVQQNASLVEEAAAATESMKAQAASLLRTMANFRLDAPDAIVASPRRTGRFARILQTLKGRRMGMKKAAGALLGAVVLVVAGVSALPARAEQPYSDAEVKSVDQANKRVVLKASEIRSIDMPPMTMPFEVRDAKMLDKLKPGDKIRIRAANEGGKFVLTEIVTAK
jgi:methyl-accepting chemotaxis protein